MFLRFMLKRIKSHRNRKMSGFCNDVITKGCHCRAPFGHMVSRCAEQETLDANSCSSDGALLPLSGHAKCNGSVGSISHIDT